LAQNDFFPYFWSKYGASATSIFYSTKAGHVVALSKEDGSVLWDSPNGSTTIPPLHQSHPAYRNGVVYVGSALGVTLNGIYRQGVVTALDANTGNVLWAKTLPGPDSTIVGYSDWKLLNDNEIETPPVPTSDGIIIEPAFCVALMDSTGRLLWRSAPTVNGGFSPYNWPPVILNDNNMYGLNNGNGYFYTFYMDSHAGTIHWVNNASPFSATENFQTPVIDSNNFYSLSDAGELFGQSLTDGSRTLYTPLLYYTDYNTDPPLNQFLVYGNRVYYQTYNEIICLTRK
jgi:outer membrane protein assembly factor BamB